MSTATTATTTIRSVWKQTRTWVYLLWQIVQDLWGNITGEGPLISFPNHPITVRRGRELAQGGFSIVWEAHAVHRNNSSCNKHSTRTYALKQCNVTDREYLRACQAEAAVHEALHHPNCMPLLGMTIVSSSSSSSYSNHPPQKTCFMLFPLFTQSLREHVNQSLLLRTNAWNEQQLLQAFHGILQGVQAMHLAQYTHRDLKLENVLLDVSHSNNSKKITPILMDFGSAGSLYAPASTRVELMNITERAAQHTTLTYRAPELLEGTLWPCEANTRTLDYQKVDVWSCACVLFAMMYGASPVEWQNGKVVECTPLSILNVCVSTTHSNNSQYSVALHQIVASTLIQDPDQRPDLLHLIQQVESLMVQPPQGTIVSYTNPADCWWYSLNEQEAYDHDMDDDKDAVSLLRSRV